MTSPIAASGGPGYHFNVVERHGLGMSLRHTSSRSCSIRFVNQAPRLVSRLMRIYLPFSSFCCESCGCWCSFACSALSAPGFVGIPAPNVVGGASQKALEPAHLPTSTSFAISVLRKVYADRRSTIWQGRHCMGSLSSPLQGIYDHSKPRVPHMSTRVRSFVARIL